jgi:hypothetical protein
MSTPFTHPAPKGAAPYWLRDEDYSAEHVAHLKAREALQAAWRARYGADAPLKLPAVPK